MLAEDRPSSLGAGKCPFQMHLHNLVPLLIGHVLEAARMAISGRIGAVWCHDAPLVSQNTSIVDED